MDELDTILKKTGAATAGVFCLAVTSGLLLWPSCAPAHAFPASEDPKVGSTVSKAPDAVAITFDSPVERIFAKLEVSDGSGQQEDAGPPKLTSDHRRLSVELKPLKPGDYTVHWSVVAEDGHRTEGSYQFTVAGTGAR